MNSHADESRPGPVSASAAHIYVAETTRRNAGWPERWLVSGAILFVLILTYAPLVWAEFAYGDDYWLLLSDQESGAAYLADGRPIFAAAQHYIHLRITDIGQLSGMRLLASVWVGLIAIQFFHLARRLGGSTLEHACLAVLLGTLPCLHTYVAQANFWLAPLAGCATIAATMFIWQAMRSDSRSILRRGFQVCAAYFLYLCTAATYQPMLAWYWTVVVLLLLDQRYVRCAGYRRRIHAVIGIGLLFLCLYYVTFKLFFVAFGIEAKGRTQLTTAPLYKLYWFLRIQLPLALNLWHLWNPTQRLLTLGTAALGLATLSAGYITACWNDSRQIPEGPDRNDSKVLRRIAIQRGLLLCCAGLMTHVHWLVIEDVPQSYRVIAPLGTAALIALYWSCRQLLQFIGNETVQQRASRAILVSAAISAILICQYTAYVYWVAPQTTSYRFLMAEIRERLTTEHSTIHLIRQGPEDGLVAEYLIESFGRPSSERAWTIDAMTRSALKDAGVPHKVQTVTNGANTDKIPEDADVLVVDMRRISNFRMAH